MMAPSEPGLMPSLNLPKAPLSTCFESEKWYVVDLLRKKKLVLTPEEWVRQHLVHYLIAYKNYPKSLFVLERGLKYNQLLKRLDILVIDRRGAPFLLIECKAPHITLTQRTVEQVCVYNHTVNARFIAISNGIKHICLHSAAINGEFVQVPDFPDFAE